MKMKQKNEKLKTEDGVSRPVDAVVIQTLLKLCNNLFELIDHCDFKNGNMAFGVDEGQSRVDETIKEYKKDFEQIKKAL